MIFQLSCLRLFCMFCISGRFERLSALFVSRPLWNTVKWSLFQGLLGSTDLRLHSPQLYQLVPQDLRNRVCLLPRDMEFSWIVPYADIYSPLGSVMHPHTNWARLLIRPVPLTAAPYHQQEFSGSFKLHEICVAHKFKQAWVKTL